MTDSLPPPVPVAEKDGVKPNNGVTPKGRWLLSPSQLVQLL